MLSAEFELVCRAMLIRPTHLPAFGGSFVETDVDETRVENEVQFFEK
jgi:hypothetical protein